MTPKVLTVPQVRDLLSIEVAAERLGISVGAMCAALHDQIFPTEMHGKVRLVPAEPIDNYSALDTYVSRESKMDWPMVYFLLAPDADMVKIGETKKINDRLVTLKAKSPVGIHLLTYLEGTRELEQELHKRFDADRSHYEWFHFSDAIKEYLYEGAGELEFQ